jgi:hypothetical protein
MIKTTFARLAVIVAVVVVATSHASAALISHWKFDEGSGQTTADSVGTNNGTLGLNASVSTDDPTWFGSGKIGTNALNYDGVNDFVEIGSPASLNVSSVTMAAWVNIDTMKRNAVFDKESNASSGDGLHMRVGVNTTDTLLRGYVGVTGSSNFTASTGSVPLGMWTHVALVSDGTYIQTYINGVADGFATITSGIFNNSVSMRLGGSAVGGLTFSLDGRIDDGGFWNSTLNGAQVRALYSLGDTSSLGYNVSQAQQLFDLYNAATGTVTIDDRNWTYTTGLSLGLGTVNQVGSDYFLQLNADGTGLMSLAPIPAPEPTTGLLLGLGLFALRAARRRK